MGNKTTEILWFIASLGVIYFATTALDGWLSNVVGAVGVFALLVMVIKDDGKRK